MFKISNLKVAALALASFVLTLSDAALAATCGMTGTATSSRVVYDPFNPTSATAHITFNLFRRDPPGKNGGKTAVVSFYFRSNDPDANGTKIVPTSVTVSGGSAFLAGKSIFYDSTNLSGPFMGPSTGTNIGTGTVPQGTNAYLKLAFTGENSASDPATVQFDVTLPPLSNIDAASQLSFNAVYRCTTTGDGPQTDQFDTLGSAITFPVTVLSALRAHYAGTALDFGEIGTLTTPSTPNTAVVGAPVPSGIVKVQSSGAYSVTLSSQNGYQLIRTDTTSPTANDKVAYKLHFLGTDVNSTSNPTPGSIAITKSCKAATLTGVDLPLSATLTEGGSGKSPYPFYADVLTITVTPLVYTDTGTYFCSSL